MDDQDLLVGQLDEDDFEEVAGKVRSDDEDLRRIGVGLEVGDHDAVVDRVRDLGLGEAVAQRRAVDVHTELS